MIYISMTEHCIGASRRTSSGDFSLALVWPIKKVALWVGLLYLTLQFQPDNGKKKLHYLLNLSCPVFIQSRELVTERVSAKPIK